MDVFEINMNTFDPLTPEEIEYLRVNNDLRIKLLQHLMKAFDEAKRDVISIYPNPADAVDNALKKAKLMLNGMKLPIDSVYAVAFVDRILQADVYDLADVYGEANVSYVKEYFTLTLQALKTLT